MHLSVSIYILVFSILSLSQKQSFHATVAFRNTSRISLRSFFSASSNPSRILDCWGLNIPLAILVFALSPVKSAVGTSPFTVRCDNTTGMLCFTTMSLIAEPKSVETPPAPSPAIYYEISTVLLNILGSHRTGVSNIPRYPSHHSSQHYKSNQPAYPHRHTGYQHEARPPH